MKYFLGVLFFVLFAVNAYSFNGVKLQEYCSGYDEGKGPVTPEQIFCSAYIFGASDTLAIHNKFICLPKNGAAKNYVSDVIKYMHENPGLLHYDAAALVNNALWSTYPCQKP